MPKCLSCLQTSAFAMFFVFSSAVLAFGQTINLQKDLGNSFKNFNLVKIYNQNTLQKAETQSRLTISTAEKIFQLNLTPRDLRSPRYRAENTDSGGVVQLEKDEITTFKGEVSGDADSEVRLTMDGAKIEGYFISGNEMFFIEPAQKYSRAAGSEDYVVYHKEDLINAKGFVCGVSEKIEQGKAMLAAESVESPQSLRVVEIATEADFEFVNTLGNATQANREILNILNMVEGVYSRELGLTISVVYQHTWTTPDPFINTNTETVLTSFKDYWNANFPVAQIPRDVAHLFSAKASVLAQGLSFVGVVCKNPAYAYGLSGRIDFVPVKYELTAHELGHSLGANHVDATQSCGNTLMNFLLTPTTQFSFCAYTQTEIANYVSANGSCLASASTPTPTPTPTPIPTPFPIPQVNINKTKFDFDGDNRADISVFRPSNGVWYILNSSNLSFNSVQFGQAGDKPAAADYDGDGRADIAVFRGGIWYRIKSSTGAFDTVSFGTSGDIPAPADFDGDGRADINVFRPVSGEWFTLRSSDGGFNSIQFGANGDVPLPTDFDGDGRADINVFRPLNGVWYRLNSGGNNSFYAVQFGANGDKPIAGDFDGDGKSDLAVWRYGVWYLLKSLNGSLASLEFGNPNDVPVAADYDGDGKTDISVFRPSNGYWYRLNSTDGSFASVQFGSYADTPIPIN